MFETLNETDVDEEFNQVINGIRTKSYKVDSVNREKTHQNQMNCK